MPIQCACHPGDIAVTVNVTAGEYLLYRVTAGACATYTLESDPGGAIFTSADCPSRCERKWTGPAGARFEHTFGIAFTSACQLEYDVELYTAANQRIKIVKHCVYTGGPGQYHEPLGVRTV